MGEQVELDFVEYGCEFSKVVASDWVELAATEALRNTGKTRDSKRSKPTEENTSSEGPHWERRLPYAVALLPDSELNALFVEAQLRQAAEVLLGQGNSLAPGVDNRRFYQTRFTMLPKSSILQRYSNGQVPYTNLFYLHTQDLQRHPPGNSLLRYEENRLVLPKVSFEVLSGDESIGAYPAASLLWEPSNDPSLMWLLVAALKAILAKQRVVIIDSGQIPLYERLRLCEALQTLVASAEATGRLLYFALDYITTYHVDVLFVHPEDKLSRSDGLVKISSAQSPSDDSELTELHTLVTQVFDASKAASWVRAIQDWQRTLAHLQAGWSLPSLLVDLQEERLSFDAFLAHLEREAHSLDEADWERIMPRQIVTPYLDLLRTGDEAIYRAHALLNSRVNLIRETALGYVTQQERTGGAIVGLLGWLELAGHGVDLLELHHEVVYYTPPSAEELDTLASSNRERTRELLKIGSELRFVDSTTLEDAVLYGWSDGGAIATVLYGDPELARRILYDAFDNLDIASNTLLMLARLADATLNANDMHKLRAGVCNLSRTAHTTLSLENLHYFMTLSSAMSPGVRAQMPLTTHIYHDWVRYAHQDSTLAEGLVLDEVFFLLRHQRQQGESFDVLAETLHSLVGTLAAPSPKSSHAYRVLVAPNKTKPVSIWTICKSRFADFPEDGVSLYFLCVLFHQLTLDCIVSADDITALLFLYATGNHGAETCLRLLLAHPDSLPRVSISQMLDWLDLIHNVSSPNHVSLRLSLLQHSVKRVHLDEEAEIEWLKYIMVRSEARENDMQEYLLRTGRLIHGWTAFEKWLQVHPNIQAQDVLYLALMMQPSSTLDAAAVRFLSNPIRIDLLDNYVIWSRLHPTDGAHLVDALLDTITDEKFDPVVASILQRHANSAVVRAKLRAFFQKTTQYRRLIQLLAEAHLLSMLDHQDIKYVLSSDEPAIESAARAIYETVLVSDILPNSDLLFTLLYRAHRWQSRPNPLPVPNTLIERYADADTLYDIDEAFTRAGISTSESTIRQMVNEQLDILRRRNEPVHNPKPLPVSKRQRQPPRRKKHEALWLSEVALAVLLGMVVLLIVLGIYILVRALP